jgi:FkbM family methyltransferase
MALNVYGPLKRARRSLLDGAARRRYLDSVEFYRQFLAPGDLCFDVGSNIGEKAEVFLSLGARVVAFEPQSACFREMVARCTPSARFVAVNAAVGAAPGRLPMYVAGREATSSLVSGWSTDIRDVIEVPITTLDAAIARHGIPRFCKIDVEGYELEVIAGLSIPVPFLSLEYTHTDVDIRKTLDCVDHLSRFGKLEMNVTLGEEMTLAWPEWVSYENFRDWFPARAPRTSVCGYGDLFIRVRVAS